MAALAELPYSVAPGRRPKPTLGISPRMVCNQAARAHVRNWGPSSLHQTVDKQVSLESSRITERRIYSVTKIVVLAASFARPAC